MDAVDRDLEAAELDAQHDMSRESPELGSSSGDSERTQDGEGSTNLAKARSFGSHFGQVDRPATRHLQHQHTIGSYRRPAPREDWPSFGDGRPCPPAIDNESYVVEFDGASDPMHPFNWAVRQKYFHSRVPDLRLPTDQNAELLSASSCRIARSPHHLQAPYSHLQSKQQVITSISVSK